MKMRILLEGVSKPKKNPLQLLKPVLICLLLAIFSISLVGCGDGMAWKPCPAEGGPCAAAPITKTSQSYPIGNMCGNAIQIEKMVPSQVREGETFDYRIKVTNLTNVTLSNVIVHDNVPDNLKIASSTPQHEMTGEGRLSWMLGMMQPQATKIINAKAMAKGEGTICSCATVTYEMPVCASIQIVNPQLRLTKSAPSEALACDRIPLEYTITNTGSGAACNVTIRDDLPKGLMTGEGLNYVMFKIDALEQGQSRTFKKMVDASSSGIFSSKAVAKSPASGGAESELVRIKITEPKLALQESGPDRQYVGRFMTYQFTVKNTGDGEARDTILTADLPSGVQFDRATESGIYTHASPGKVTWKLGQLEPGQSRTVQMTVSTDQSGVFSTTAKAQAYCAETVTAKAQTSLSGISAILLEVVDQADPVEVGQNEEYIITVTNQGSSDGTNISVSCQLEDDMQYISSSGPTNARVAGKTIIFEPLAKLEPKSRASWRVKVKAMGEGDMRFKAIMKSDQLGRIVEETEATMFYK